ncbi:MAG TPA: primosomal protein N' [Terriglobia bacterium]|nr:primosomal protein N' [Terriglobia bacterium]
MEEPCEVKTQPGPFAEVAVCLPLSRTFTYSLSGPAAIGCRVVVPFRGRDVEGFIVGLRDTAPESFDALPAREVMDHEPLLPADVFALCRWIADYYFAPLGEVLKSALPPGITQKRIERAVARRSEKDPAKARALPPDLGLALTPDQQRALDTIENVPGFGAILLHGVTGSGKTEVYIQATRRALDRGRTSLVLVPEIGLTPQLAERFAIRFPGRTAVLHSGLTSKQRIEEWTRIRRGDAPVVIGTRSAVFAPLENLGLVIVDEEHETSYKQEETPRYHARDTAIVRARNAGAAIVLGSATPSMESFRNGEAGKFTVARLPSRVEQRPLPKVEVVNMREEYVVAGRQVVFSERLLGAIATRLERREQTIVLLNRRGFAAFLLCRKCGFTYDCSACSVSLTYHRSIHKLLCHYCGLAKRPPERCPECASEHIHYVGEGTERLEHDLTELFPAARIARVDRDVMRHPRDFERVLGAFRNGDTDILVGTQMIAKGHDFPNVTLVGVISADASLALPDFRAAERTFQLLTQVAGRSGRGDRPGEVVIQSYHPDHYTFQLAETQRFEDFYQRESRYRRALFYPPFSALAGIVVSDRNAERAAQTSRDVGQFLGGLGEERIRVIGPAPAPLERLKRVHRYQLLIKAATRDALHRALDKLQANLESKKPGSTRVMIDVDPVSLM